MSKINLQRGKLTVENRKSREKKTDMLRSIDVAGIVVSCRDRRNTLRALITSVADASLLRVAIVAIVAKSTHVSNYSSMGSASTSLFYTVSRCKKDWWTVIAR